MLKNFKLKFITAILQIQTRSIAIDFRLKFMASELDAN